MHRQHRCFSLDTLYFKVNKTGLQLVSRPEKQICGFFCQAFTKKVCKWVQRLSLKMGGAFGMAKPLETDQITFSIEFAIPSETSPHLKVTGERNQTGGIQHLLICFCFYKCFQSPEPGLFVHHLNIWRDNFSQNVYLTLNNRHKKHHCVLWWWCCEGGAKTLFKTCVIRLVWYWLVKPVVLKNGSVFS